MSHAEAEIRRRGAVPAEIEEEGPRGEAARQEVGRLTYEINVQQYACAGLNFGAYYDTLADHRLRRRQGAVLYDEQLYAFDGPGLPHAAFLVRRRPFALRRDGSRNSRCCDSMPTPT